LFEALLLVGSDLDLILFSSPELPPPALLPLGLLGLSLG
tara:strand:- start:1439 stop:1555 length:117 start_codon:yes stop_codon:yes gene_type:complete